MTYPLSNKFILLQQEGYLMQSCICGGLDQLTNANLDDKGAFYGAFFNISIGVERLLKAIVMIDYFAENNFEFPPERFLKDMGHNILRLYDRVKEVNSRCTNIADIGAVDNALNFRILNCISEFALRTRYSNLNNLQSGIRLNDPLSVWYSILKEVFASDVSIKKRAKVEFEAFFVGNFMEKAGLILSTGLDGESLDFNTGIMSAGIVRESIPHAVLRLFWVLKPLRSIMSEVVSKAHALEHKTGVPMPTVPYMSEFLSFLGYDAKSVLKMKHWR